MDLNKAKNKMNELLKEHNLSNWSFDFDRAVRRLGQCVWKKNTRITRKITMSRVMTESRTDKEVINTMLHEIAHAIDFETRGISLHDEKWKSSLISDWGMIMLLNRLLYSFMKKLSFHS